MQQKAIPSETPAHNGKRGLLFERFAWIAFALMGFVVVVFGIGDFVAGTDTFAHGGEGVTVRGVTGSNWSELSSGPAAALIDWKVKAQAIWMTLAGAITALVAVTGFRRGERWAWFAMALWPLAFGAVYLNLSLAYRHPGAATPPPLKSAPIFIVVALVALAFSFRKAFRRPAEA